MSNILRALATRAGILDDYIDNDGQRRTTSDATRTALLAAMGFDVATEPSARAALEAFEQRETGYVLAPVHVVSERRAHQVDVRGPASWQAGARVAAEWLLEDGSSLETVGVPYRSRNGTARIRLHASPPIGYHRLRLHLDGHGTATQWRIVVPDHACTVRELIGRSRAFGFVANLYSVRSAQNWGAGDFGDLRTLVELCAAAGGDFVGLNPLHALRNRGHDISPYSPISRLFRNPLYLDIASVPELRDSPEAQAMLDSAPVREALAQLRGRDRVDYAAVARLKQAVLDLLFATFATNAQSRESGRAREFNGWVEQQGQALTDFATFLALESHFARVREGTGWPVWPLEYQDPRSSAVQQFQAEHAHEIRRHAWIQFEMDRQLGVIARLAAGRGLRIGIYDDLALGSAWNGSDAWSFPGLFVPHVSLGAPPDAYSAIGQDWALPPLHPHRLADGGYRYWRLLIRNALAHAGALRIDHVMGLFRQFWIPAGHRGDEGAYVRYPAEDLLGIIALESRRAGALIIGEDLGTVPRGLPRVLDRWGILSSRVLYFEQDRRGAFRPSRRYSRRALVTVNTHDHAPFAGYWSARDLELRRALGTLPASDYAEAVHRRGREKDALIRRLVTEGVLRAEDRRDRSKLAAAAHGFLARSPSPLLGIALDDLTAETEPVNVPGVAPEQHPSWTRRLRLSLGAIPGDAHTAGILNAVRKRARALPDQPARTRRSGRRPSGGSR
jgi:4-alpha-glucanotransferase